MKQTIQKEKTQRLYHDLAWLFPILTPAMDYVPESKAYTEMIRRHAHIPARTLLNLGCGAGHHDSAMKANFAITGVDISETMLEMARKLNPEIDYLHGDMRTLKLGRTFDVVTIFDSLAYMCTEADLRAAFATATRHLNPGGVFLSVLHETRETLVQNRTSFTTHRAGGVDLVFIENYYDPDPADTTYECTMVYLIRRNGLLSVETDLHVCGLFPLAAWEEQFAAAGLDLKTEAYVDEGFDGRTYPVLIGIKPE